MDDRRNRDHHEKEVIEFPHEFLRKCGSLGHVNPIGGTMKKLQRLHKLFAVLTSLLLTVVVPAASAQQPPIVATSSVSLSLTVQAAASMVCTPSSITFTYTGGTGTASGPISCTFSWNVGPGYTFIDFAAYLAGGASAGLTGPNTTIPASNIFSSNDGAANVPCTQTVPATFPGAGGGSNAGCYVLIPSNPNASGQLSGSMTHTFLLTVSQGGLQSGVYTGSLTVVADIQ
jgi:hypothetical protein